MCFPLKIKAWVAFGLPYLLIELFYIGMPVVRTHGRCTVTWLPNFLGSVDYHISWANGLRAARGAPPWTCQVLFRKKNAIICILARNTWASVSVIYYPSIKCKYNRLFYQKSLMTLFHIYEWKVISLYACKRAKDDSQSVVDIDKRMYVFTLLMVL